MGPVSDANTGHNATLIVDPAGGMQRIEINIIRVSFAPQAGMADKIVDIPEVVL